MTLPHYSPSEIKDKKVLLRLDLDVAVTAAGAVDDVYDLRLRRVVPTIQELLSFGAKQIIICGHRGRPAGKFDPVFGLAPVSDRLELLLNKAGVQLKINLVSVDAPDNRPADVLVMLENLRFYPDEKKGSSDFAQMLAAWGEVYVNEAFGASHRSDASLLAITKFLPHFAGPALSHEVEELTRFMTNTPRPYVAVLGGAKIETKIPLIKQLLEKADVILVAGAMANTVLVGRGINVGRSVVENEYLGLAKELNNPKIILPIDAVLADGKIKSIDKLEDLDFIGDIGPATVDLFKEKVSTARAILWNGPLGKFEDAIFQAGTKSVAAAITASAALTITGGGDTLDVLTRLRIMDKFGFVSVGGGAMLTFLAGEPMPALDVLSSRPTQ